MKQKLTFKVFFSDVSNHWVHVVVHTTLRALRSHMTRRKHKTSGSALACCWQANNPARDHCVAVIHLAADIVTLDHIAHESTHAAWHRSVLIGLKLTEDRFQEWVADDTGHLTDCILARLDSQGIRVRYDSVPKRSATKRYVKQ